MREYRWGYFTMCGYGYGAPTGSGENQNSTLNQSKRDSSTTQANALTGVSAKKRRRLAPLGMTGFVVGERFSEEHRGTCKTASKLGTAV